MGLLEVLSIFIACAITISLISAGIYGIFTLFNPPKCVVPTKYVPIYDPYMQVPSSKISITKPPANLIIRDKLCGLKTIKETTEEPECGSLLCLQNA